MNEKEFIEAGREWLREDKQKKLEMTKQYRLRGKEKYPDRYSLESKKFRESHPNYAEEHRLDLLANSKKYYKTEKGKACNQRARTLRRTKEKTILNTLSFSEWLDILIEYENKCAYCGTKFNDNNRSQRDHIIPISKGGDNTKENVVPSCGSCNSKKGGRLL